jgi:hypothetical protein
MALFYGPFLKRWARFFFAYLIFLLWTAVLVGAGTALLVASMWSLKGVAVATIALPALFLLYWRVLGRYAWYVTTRRMRKPRKQSMKPVKGVTVESLDPWAMPPSEMTEPLPRTTQAGDREEDTFTSTGELTDVRDKLAPADSYKLAPVEEGIKVAAADKVAKLEPAPETTMDEEEDEWTPKKKPYGVMTDDEARQNWVERQKTSCSDIDGYAVEEISLGQPVSLWQYYSERAKQEEKLREEGKSVRQFERPRKPPTLWQAMTQEIGRFLFYPHSLRAWINLAIFFAIELAVLNVIVSMTRMIVTAQ